MQLPGFTADRSLQLPNGTYRTRSLHGDVKMAIKLQFTWRPDRPPGRPPHPFPPFGPELPFEPTYCDTDCLRKCQQMFQRECDDALCVLETMPICRNNCCITH